MIDVPRLLICFENCSNGVRSLSWDDLMDSFSRVLGGMMLLPLPCLFAAIFASGGAAFIINVGLATALL